VPVCLSKRNTEKKCFILQQRMREKEREREGGYVDALTVALTRLHFYYRSHLSLQFIIYFLRFLTSAGLIPGLVNRGIGSFGVSLRECKKYSMKISILLFVLYNSIKLQTLLF
jgi:hypothetical protein